MQRPHEHGTTAPLFDPAALDAVAVLCTGLGVSCACPRCTEERQEAIDRDGRARRRREAERDRASAEEREAVERYTMEAASRRRQECESDRAVTMARWARWQRAAILMYGRGTPWAVLPAHRSPSAER